MRLPPSDTLDLHPFRPSEVRDLVPDWLQECREAGFTRVRIVHGKGSGALREKVHAILRHLPWVRNFGLAGDRSAWGATVIELEPWGSTGPGAPPRQVP